MCSYKRKYEKWYSRYLKSKKNPAEIIYICDECFKKTKLKDLKDVKCCNFCVVNYKFVCQNCYDKNKS